MTAFYGKYRGTVTDNTDPRGMARVRVSVPAVYGDDLPRWAMPCAPFGGDRVGLFALPPVGANVWVEFEAGDPDRPIWVGCFWLEGQVPASPATPDRTVLRTTSVTVTFTSSGLTIETTGGQRFELSGSSVELANGNGATLRMSGNTMSLNDGALEVT